MPTFFIDPERLTNGSGTFTSPFNSWVGVSITAGNSYLQAEGTTFPGSIVIPVGVTNVTLGVYDRLTGERLSDLSRRALVDGAGSQLTIRVREGAHNALIEGFEVFGSDANTQRWAFYLGNTAAQPADGTVLRNCVARDVVPDGSFDCGGVKFFGSNVTIQDVVVHDIPTDGIWGQGNDATIERARVWGIGTDGRAFGDCIQIFGNATLGCRNAQIRDCWLDHTDGSYKQVIIIQDQTDASVGCVVENNTMLMAPFDGNNSNIMYIEVPNAVIRGNRCSGGYFGIFSSASAMSATGNVVTDTYYGVYQGSTEVGARFHNNTVMRCKEYGIYADQDTTFRAYNNLIIDAPRGIGLEGGALEDFNLFHNVEETRRSLGGGGTWGARSRSVPNIWDYINPDGSLKTPVMVDGVPMLNPLGNAGTYVGGVRLMGGQRLNPYRPVVGAFPEGRY